ncbi:reverse gyrase [Paenibacillus popilliae ATCC 14706]|uniref:Reverse gyrase n=1 Tax=Paenibacillus popilliae ATCC 14706 TaxID=1212764 RepID=M9M0W2_PAEPP|nr:reverse gyrase [Paenibacillus popilliae ATCC 14706]
MWMRGLKCIYSSGLKTYILSHPMWMRGLKYIICSKINRSKSVASYVDAWIEICRKLSEYSGDFVASYVDAWIEIHL